MTDVPARRYENPFASRATRPCPFYSQGRCLFAATCAFRHDIKITAKVTDGVGTSAPATPRGPVIAIDSPRSALSSPRSPRLQGLLTALAGAIEDDDAEVEELLLDSPGSSASTSTALPIPPPLDIPTARAALHDELRSLFAARAQLHPHSPASSTASATVRGASPRARTHSSPAGSLDSLDSPSHRAALPLSPVFSPSAVPFPLLGFPERTESCDSGYAESWPAAASPLPTPTRSSFGPFAPTSTLELLGSPFGSVGRRMSRGRSAPPSPALLPYLLSPSAPSERTFSPPDLTLSPPARPLADPFLDADEDEEAAHAGEPSSYLVPDEDEDEDEDEEDEGQLLVMHDSMTMTAVTPTATAMHPLSRGSFDFAPQAESTLPDDRSLAHDLLDADPFGPGEDDTETRALFFPDTDTLPRVLPTAEHDLEFAEDRDPMLPEGRDLELPEDLNLELSEDRGLEIPEDRDPMLSEDRHLELPTERVFSPRAVALPPSPSLDDDQPADDIPLPPSHDDVTNFFTDHDPFGPGLASGPPAEDEGVESENDDDDDTGVHATFFPDTETLPPVPQAPVAGDDDRTPDLTNSFTADGISLRPIQQLAADDDDDDDDDLYEDEEDASEVHATFFPDTETLPPIADAPHTTSDRQADLTNFFADEDPFGAPVEGEAEQDTQEHVTPAPDADTPPAIPSVLQSGDSNPELTNFFADEDPFGAPAQQSTVDDSVEDTQAHDTFSRDTEMLPPAPSAEDDSELYDDPISHEDSLPPALSAESSSELYEDPLSRQDSGSTDLTSFFTDDDPFGYGSAPVQASATDEDTQEHPTFFPDTETLPSMVTETDSMPADETDLRQEAAEEPDEADYTVEIGTSDSCEETALLFPTPPPLPAAFLAKAMCDIQPRAEAPVPLPHDDDEASMLEVNRSMEQDNTVQSVYSFYDESPLPELPPKEPSPPRSPADERPASALSARDVPLPPSQTVSPALRAQRPSINTSAVLARGHSPASSVSSSLGRRVFTPPPGAVPRQRAPTPTSRAASPVDVRRSNSASPRVLAPKDSSLLRNREARRQESVSSASTSSEDVPTPASSITSPIDPRQSPKAPSSKLRPLRLSRLVTPSPLSSAFPTSSSSSGFILDGIPDSPVSSPVAPSVASSSGFSANPSLSSVRNAMIPEHIQRTLIPAHDISPLTLAVDASAGTHGRSYPLRTGRRRNASPLVRSATGLGITMPWGSALPSSSRPASPASAPFPSSPRISEVGSISRGRSPAPVPSPSPPEFVPPTPRPDLLFAIAADDPGAVRTVLDGGADANASIGPQTALAFAVANPGLGRKADIVKALLAYGADTRALDAVPADEEATLTPGVVDPSTLDPVVEYYLGRAQDPEALKAAALVQRSEFRPLARVRYDLVGQDRALEQLFRVLSMQAQRLTAGSVVVMLCGGSGLGKTLVAQRFGTLLEVPSHSVNMVNVRSGQDLWDAYSSADSAHVEDACHQTLSQFLIEHEGRRCVVVLDEIEKTLDEKALWTLHMPWESGRYPLEAGRPHVDMRQVIWVATSNIGAQLVSDHDAGRVEPGAPLARAEYGELMRLARQQASERLGAALVSRVTAVLPFVPFDATERTAIAAEALLSLGGDLVRDMDVAAFRAAAGRAQAGYIPQEGARSLYRAVSTLLMDEL